MGEVLYIIANTIEHSSHFIMAECDISLMMNIDDRRSAQSNQNKFELILQRFQSFLNVRRVSFSYQLPVIFADVEFVNYQLK